MGLNRIAHRRSKGYSPIIEARMLASIGTRHPVFEEDEQLLKRIKSDRRLALEYRYYQNQGLHRDGMSFTRYLTKMGIGF